MNVALAGVFVNRNYQRRGSRTVNGWVPREFPVTINSFMTEAVIIKKRVH